MGIENRDYFRESSNYSGAGGWDLGWMPPACKYLLFVTVAVFLLQILVTRPARPADIFPEIALDEAWPEEIPEEELAELPFLPRVSVVQEWLQLETDKVVRHGQIWRLLTCAFCHDRVSVWHIVINMLLLFWFGRTLEAMYGSTEFLLFYLTAAVAASVAYIGLDLYTGELRPAIGASGAVMAVMMLYAAHYPRSTICMFMLIPIEIRWLLALYVIYDLHPVLLALAGERLYTGVAHAAHLGGLAFGFVYWKRGLRLERFWDRLRLPRRGRRGGARRSIRLHQPAGDQSQQKLDTVVDVILQKVHEEGEASLTEQEREVLRIASDEYRGRGDR